MTAPDPAILAAAITRMEAEIALFPEADFPAEHEQTRAVVAAAKAYQPMQVQRQRLVFALTKAADQFDRYGREHREKARASRGNGLAAAAVASDAKALTNEVYADLCRAALNLAGPA